MSHRGSSVASVLLQIREGELTDVGSFVYVWVRAGERRVVYVGATGLPPAARTWLHLHDPDPEVGRIRAGYPPAASEALDVLAFTLPAGVAREDLRDSLVLSLHEDGLLAPDYAGPQPRPDAPRSVDARFDGALADIERQVNAHLTG